MKFSNVLIAAAAYIVASNAAAIPAAPETSKTLVAARNLDLNTEVDAKLVARQDAADDSVNTIVKRGTEDLLSKVPLGTIIKAVDLVLAGTISDVDSLLSFLGITVADAGALGLSTVDGLGALVSQLVGLIGQTVDGLLSKRDVESILKKIPLGALSEAVGLVVTGTIGTVNDLLTFLDLTLDDVAELGLSTADGAGSLVSSLVGLIGQTVDGLLSKRGLEDLLSKVPLGTIIKAVDLVLAGTISDVDSLLSFLGITVADAGALGLSTVDGLGALVSQLVGLIGKTADGLLSKRGLEDLLSKVPLGTIIKAVDLVLAGTISDVDSLLSFLGITVADAGALGLSTVDGLGALVSQLVGLIGNAVDGLL
ncbi:hypothetical protein PVL30_004395 [Lodderomyces elongisporus]|uniref:uncharacterized protein n=1 Tax=Lodderomyces elongisporus TaxID=36914 RepID=UPI00291FA8DB|nr:uncharacterized protein PVL30_004395 [Lodderomyces elongisporus]WLF80610.1 hypothetical protein PVL30_004395 [Lodderomyces elongisporus]